MPEVVIQILQVLEACLETAEKLGLLLILLQNCGKLEISLDLLWIGISNPWWLKWIPLFVYLFIYLREDTLVIMGYFE